MLANSVRLAGGIALTGGLHGVGAASGATSNSAPQDALDCEIEITVPAKYYEDGKSWVHARAGIIPGAGENGQPAVVMTLNVFAAEGSDVFPEVITMRTNDLGKTWSEPRAARALAPRIETIQGKPLTPVSASDFFPKFHHAAGKLLNIGHTIAYGRGDLNHWLLHQYRERHTIYSTYDEANDRWQPWKRLFLPEEDRKFFFHCAAGCVQRYDLPDGDILLPVYVFPPGSPNASTFVFRCTFDGHTLRYADRGNELRVDEGRGMGEPSLTRFGDEFFLTMRNDSRGYVTRGKDGLHFDEPKPWTFDDGQELGNYNTQQHWITHSDGLFLVYNRRGANNDHVFRHRAPLFMAQVDPERLVVLRDTEKIVAPERGARLGNFGVTNVTQNETWVTVAEAMRNIPDHPEKLTADGSLYVTRLKWNRPNALLGS